MALSQFKLKELACTPPFHVNRKYFLQKFLVHDDLHFSTESLSNSKHKVMQTCK